MSDEINAVKTNINSFADDLKSKGVDYRLALVTFRDAIANTYIFTNDVRTFHNYIDVQYADGGDDYPENSLAALIKAADYPFRKDAKRIIIWITDASYHEKDGFTDLTKADVNNKTLLNGVTVYCIGDPSQQTAFYDPITSPTGGKFYDIYGNFKDILLDIAKLKDLSKYLLSYSSPAVSADSRQIALQIRYAGLGGSTEVDLGKKKASNSIAHFSFYPNPFNPEISFRVNTKNYLKATLKIYNMLGQCIKSFNMDTNNDSVIRWDATNDCGGRVASGFYIAQLRLKSGDGKQATENAKILYLK
jgi:hypothetical protein